MEVWPPEPEPRPSMPGFGALLVLNVPNREEQFWQSPTHQATARSFDWWASCCLLFTDCLYFRFQFELQEIYLVPRLLHAALQLLTTLFQLGCINHYWASYGKVRTRLLWIHRILRVLVLVFLSVMARSIILSGRSGAHTSNDTYIPGSMAAAQSPANAARAVVLSSGSLLAFTTAVMPLPLPHHILGQLLQLVLLLTLQLPTTRYMLRATVAEGHIQQLCRHMNSGIDLLALAYLGATPGALSLDRRCDTRSSDIVVLFADLFVGVVLPVYVAYCTERQQKLAFLRTLQQENGEDNQVQRGSYVVAVVSDVFLLLLAAFQCWVLALVGYKYLPLIMVPVRSAEALGLPMAHLTN